MQLVPKRDACFAGAQDGSFSSHFHFAGALEDEENLVAEIVAVARIGLPDLHAIEAHANFGRDNKVLDVVVPVVNSQRHGHSPPARA